MPGWTANVVGWIQQFAEEEGLLLGVTLAGYAMDLWIRLFQASRSLDRVKHAPTLGISKIPLLTGADKTSQGSFSEPSSSSISASGSSSRSDASSAADPSEGRSNHEDPHGGRLTAAECSAVMVPESDSTNQQQQQLRAVRGDAWDSIVVVRGRVQPSWDPQLWQRFSGPTLVKTENSKTQGVVVERIDKVSGPTGCFTR